MKRRRSGRQLGFSMVELAMVLMMGLIIMGMSVVELQPVLQQIRANAGVDQVKSTLRQARELAISDRRTIVVQFRIFLTRFL
jgi:Tfp pilus assembly protein FimT